MTKRSHQRRVTGFTLVELLMASFIVSIALLGVYSLFQQTLEVEGKMSLNMLHQNRAVQVVGYLAEELKRCINLPDMDTIQMSYTPQAGSFEWVAVGKGFSGSSFESQGIVRKRITWKLNAAQDAYTLNQQVMRYAGTSNMSFTDESQANWNILPVTELFHEIDALEVEIQKTDQPQGGWLKEYQGEASHVAIRIKAVSGERDCQRIILPAVNAVVE